MKPPKSDWSKAPREAISRRQFGRKAAVAAAATFTVPALLQAGATSPEAVRLQEKKPEPLEGLTPEQTAEVDARLANILRRYGSRFNDDQKARLRRILAQNERMMGPVRAFSLENGDPPASVLRIRFDNPEPMERKERL
ncbi:MAG TPA: hypothetical protein VMF66_03360 [Candidatus Acidoferrum sp.]|nr:hypothetical protein [Candidatus Acidoferrum sp.]